MSVCGISVESKNLILQSMKDALIHMIRNHETADDSGYSYREDNASSINVSPSKNQKRTGPPRVYEKLIQKLEADVRGHIRLEHEMKIHMDYLEGKVEKMEREKTGQDKEVENIQKQVQSLQDKLKLLKEDRDAKDREFKKQKKLNDDLKAKL